MDLNQTLLTRDANTLTQAELLSRIAYKIQRRYDFTISDDEAYAAARALTGFCQTLLDINTHRGNVKP
jgi:hypothetical protein